MSNPLTTNQLTDRLTPYTPTVLSAFRIVFGLLYTAHGSSKLFGYPLPIAEYIPAFTLFWWAGLVEFTAGMLILLGLFTRAAAFIASGEMAVAYFTQHQPHALWPIDPAQTGDGGGEPAVLYCFGFLLLVFTGGGAWALDAVRARRGSPS